MRGAGDGSYTAADCMRPAARAKGASYWHTLTIYHNNTRGRRQATTQEGRARNHKTKTLKEPVGTGGAGLARPQRKSGGLPIAGDSKNGPERFYEQ